MVSATTQWSPVYLAWLARYPCCACGRVVNVVAGETAVLCLDPRTFVQPPEKRWLIHETCRLESRDAFDFRPYTDAEFAYPQHYTAQQWRDDPEPAATR